MLSHAPEDDRLVHPRPLSSWCGGLVPNQYLDTSQASDRIRQLGAEPGDDDPDLVQRQIEEQLGGLWKGAPDTQMASALTALSKRLLKTNCGATEAVADSELISWIRGDNVRSPNNCCRSRANSGRFIKARNCGWPTSRMFKSVPASPFKSASVLNCERLSTVMFSA